MGKQKGHDKGACPPSKAGIHVSTAIISSHTEGDFFSLTEASLGFWYYITWWATQLLTIPDDMQLGFGELFIKMPLSHKGVLWSRTVGRCFSKLKIKDGAIPMANENENLMLAQKCLGRRNDFLLMKENGKQSKEAVDLSPLRHARFMYSSKRLSDLLSISLFKFQTFSSIHHFFTSQQLAPYLCP